MPNEQTTKVEGQGSNGVDTITSFSEKDTSELSQDRADISALFDEVIDKKKPETAQSNETQSTEIDQQSTEKPEESTDLKVETEQKSEDLSKTSEDNQKKVEQSQQSAPVEKQEPDPKQDPNYDPEIDGLELHKNASQASKDNFKVVKGKAKEFKELARKAVEGAAGLEAKLKEIGEFIGADPSKLKQELDELRAFRRSMDVAHDPEFKTQFDDKITATYKDIMDVLVERQMPQALVDKYNARGGFAGFSEQELAQIFYGEENGLLTIMKESSDPMDKKAAAIIERKIENVMDLKHQKELKIQESGKNHAEFYKKQAEQKQADVKKFYDEESQHISGLKQVAKAEAAKYGIPVDLEIVPDGATEEQKMQINARNQVFQNYVVPTFNKAIYASTTEDRIKNGVAAVAMPLLRQKIVTLEKELADKAKFYEGELNRLKVAGTMPKASSSPTPSQKSFKDADGSENARDSLEKIMQDLGV